MTVDLEACSPTLLLVHDVGVPAEHVVLALVVVRARLVLVTLLDALGGEWPLVLRSAVVARGTVRILLAIVEFLSADADAFFAPRRLARERVDAAATWVQVLLVRGRISALGAEHLVFEL